tara:strand:- start:53 stop:649 length:597 start_codon:yes stop_codon:yes gene_type:complete
MAVSEKAINFIQGSLERGRPIPGQSLTNSPDQPYRWEQPPEYANPKEAMLYVFETLTVPETTTNMLMSLNNGVGVIDIASITLYSGFLEGKWSPDVMMLLMEPTMYMIMALAEKAEIEYQLEAGDDEVPNEMNPDQHIEKLKGGLNQLDELKRQAVERVSPQSVPEDVREVIEETTLSPSLLERVQQESQDSLLAREK